jgi:cytochrome c
MADLTFNKIAGAALATGLVIFGLQQLTRIVFEQEPPEHPGYAVAVAETGGGGGEAADTIPDWGTVLPKADIAKGQAVTGKCASCHQFAPADTPNIGPGL